MENQKITNTSIDTDVVFKPIELNTVDKNKINNYNNSLNDLISKSLDKWYGDIENKLREIKEKEAPELTDEEFAKFILVEFHMDDNNPYAVIRLKTPEEILMDIKKNNGV